MEFKCADCDEGTVDRKAFFVGIQDGNEFFEFGTRRCDSKGSASSSGQREFNPLLKWKSGRVRG